MNRASWAAALLVCTCAVAPAVAGPVRERSALDRVNACLAGRVVDYTHNHGADHRIWSEALGKPRDLYVYLPPHYDPTLRYPFVLYLHAIQQDEKNFLDPIVGLIDRAIVAGTLPPLIVAAPDGSITGRPTWFGSGSFFVNSKAGRFEDYVVHDVWDFVVEHYPIRPEREAHVVLGASMGGFGAYNLALKHPELFKVVAGVFPPVNTRWVDCCGRYYGSHFSPDCIGFRTTARPHEVVARYYGVPIRFKQIVDPLYGRGPDVLDALSYDNPTEMLERLDVQPGVYDFYIGYGGRDQFNVTAQVDSFVYFAGRRGIHIDVNFLPEGRHDTATGVKLFPDLAVWVNARLVGYGPIPCLPSSAVLP